MKSLYRSMLAATGLAAAMTVIPTLAREAAAQTASSAAPSENCQAPANQQSADGGQNHPKQQATKDLSNCGGVLKPPAVDDGGMAKPAPSTGNTPVIKPDQLPKNGGQQNPDGQPK